MERKKIQFGDEQDWATSNKWLIRLQVAAGSIYFLSGFIRIYHGSRDFFDYLFMGTGILLVLTYSFPKLRQRNPFRRQPRFIELDSDRLLIQEHYFNKMKIIPWDRFVFIQFKPAKVLLHIQDLKNPIIISQNTYAVHQEIRATFIQIADEKGIRIEDWHR